MSILAVLEAGGAEAAAAIEQATVLLAAIEQHRTALDTLLRRRRQHVVELRNAGWELVPIGELYGLTPERVRQLVTASARPDVDDGAKAVD